MPFLRCLAASVKVPHASQGTCIPGPPAFWLEAALLLCARCCLTPCPLLICSLRQQQQRQHHYIRGHCLPASARDCACASLARPAASSDRARHPEWDPRIHHSAVGRWRQCRSRAGQAWETVEPHVCPHERDCSGPAPAAPPQDSSGSTLVAKETLPLSNILDASTAHGLSRMPCCNLSIHCIYVHAHRSSLASDLLAGSRIPQLHP